ncbi:MAG TPA: tetratricopeptide repeat protein [Steroidobacteraceae bacterium]|nr:tetratricopeptide repeat protein [Steroidobacteraceae bacterium]
MAEHARKVAAILAADVVDYSRLMGADEPATLDALKIRRALFERLVTDFDGREFGSVGDSLMAQFPSAVNAVRCAQAIQAAVAQENGSLAPERRMQLRIGINLGDVIEEDGALFGDGVNVAARLQSLAEPGGILISGAVHEQVRKKLAATFRFVGAKHVKNIADPVPAYEVQDSEQPASFFRRLARHPRRWHLLVAVVTVVALSLIADAFWYWRGSVESPVNEGAQPSVAVLPFVNMSSEPGNEPFVDGLSEEVLNVLAGIDGLKVAGRTSSFYFKGKNEKAAVIAETLGVNHLLEGSVRWAGSKVRITAQLIKASDGFHLWSRTFDRDTQDIFAVQEEIARAVADELRVELLPTDEAHLAKRGTSNAEAHRLYLVARGRMRERGLPNLRAAKALFENAIGLDPSYASAYSGLADTYFLLINNHLQELDTGEQAAERAVARALELDPGSSEAYTSRANVATIRYFRHGEARALDRAIADYRRAIELDPTNAQAQHWYAVIIEEQDPDAAMRALERALALDPLMRQAQLTLANVYFDRGQYAKARERIQEVIDRYPDFAGAYRTAGDLEYRSGHLAEARARYAAAYELEPDTFGAASLYIINVELGDRAAAKWEPQTGAVAMFDLAADAVRLSLDRQYPHAVQIFRSGLDRFIGDPWYSLMASHLELLVGQPQRSTAILLGRSPELAGEPISINNCDAAIALATALRQSGRAREADQLLRRLADWLDGDLAARRPQRWVARAEVHALLNERDAAFAALDRAFDAGHRSILSSAYIGIPYPGDDNPAFASVRDDPRLAAWYARIRADNARQLAASRGQGSTGD